MKDTIIKSTEKTGNFTIMLNDVFKRDDLSARAKGVYGYLMTLPNGWKLHKTELYEHFTEGRDALDKAFKELMEAGYITQEVVKEKGKFVSFEYTIYEESISGKPVTGKPLTGKPFTENPHLLNTDLVLNTNKINTENKKHGKQEDKETLFSTFYQVYPKKVDKISASKKFNALIRQGVTLETILSKLEVYKNQIIENKTETKFIRGPVRFLSSLEDYDIPEKATIPEKKILLCPECGIELRFGVCPSCLKSSEETNEKF